MHIRLNRRASQVCKPDNRAVQELLNRHYADIFAYLRRLSSSTEEAKDLTQETFLKVWASRDGFRGRSRFSTWVYRIAYNTYIDWKRKKEVGLAPLCDEWWQECVDTSPGPPAELAERQTAQHVYEAVDRLDEDKKQVVHLHYYQGLSIRQTAKVLGMSTSAVKYRLREVLKILRAEMEIEEEPHGRKSTIQIPKGESL